MCFVFIVVSVIFVAKIVWFCGFPTSITSSMKVDDFNVVHSTKV